MTILPCNYNEETGWGHSDATPYPREIFASPLNMHHRTRPGPAQDVTYALCQ